MLLLSKGRQNKNKKNKFYLIQHPMQLIPGLNNTVSIITVNHKNKALCVLEVMSPQRTDLGKKERGET